MKNKKLVLIPLVGIIAAFTILNMEANQKSHSKDNQITAKCIKIPVVVEDENPEGVTLLSLGEDDYDAKTQGKGEVKEETSSSNNQETKKENK